MAAAARVCRQFIAFTVLCLVVVDLQCHYFRAGALSTALDKIGDSSTLETANRYAWRKSGAAVSEKLGSAAVDASSKARISRTTNLRRSLEQSGVNSTRGEVEALSAFKAAITSDPLGVLRSWHSNDSDACSWDGVVCSVQHPNHVVALDLGGRQLVGDLNSAMQEVGSLPYLQRLDLSMNVFTGSIPAVSLANFSNLLYLNISYNHVSGEIPFQLGELVNLQTLDFLSNNLTGEIPISIGNCTALKVLNLGSNSLEGNIPPAIGRLSSLAVLGISFSSISGSIPLEMGNCSSLTSLDLGYNTNLGGELPLEMNQLKLLQQLDLSQCNFQGAFPAWLGNLTALNAIFLTLNQFSGEMPEEIGQLRELQRFSLGGNNFTGPIPTSITNCTKLYDLRLGQNQLTGDIPPFLGSLRSLEVLYLWGNQFTGIIPFSLANCSALRELELELNPFLAPQVIPTWMGSLTNLIHLHLASMNLHGNIPEEIGLLSNLQWFILDQNNLSGPVHSTWLKNCTSLTDLELGQNQFTGEIPPEIGLLTQLTWFEFGENFFTGPFPAFVPNLTQLVYFDVGNNSLTGTIDGDFGRLSQMTVFSATNNYFSGPLPETLSNCSSLYWIGLRGNNLSGEIPLSWGNISSLQVIYLGYNQIEGNIPTSLMTMPSLGVLDLQNNKLEGTIPSDIGRLISLGTLFLNNNGLTGEVPSSIGNCSVMTIMDLSYNAFTGTVPGEAISTMVASLQSLNISHNLFSGSWPPQFSRLTNIIIIDVSFNNISGSIPASLGSGCKSLERLDVSNNDLSGAIPSDLGLLQNLQFFNASYNNFQGPIPDAGVFKSNLTRASFLGNPRLCGSILGPQQECGAPTTHQNATKHSCRGFKCKNVWIPTTCAIIGAVLIAVAVLTCWTATVYKSRRNSVSNDGDYGMVNFVPHVSFSESDVLGTISGSGDNIIGAGAKSVVYKGLLPRGEVFAVKVFRSSQSGEDHSHDGQRKCEMFNEVQTLAKLRHRNILKVLSYLSTSDVKAIILEYMPQGSLHKHLHAHEQGACELPWQARFDIAVGVAEALVYLHHDSPEPLIHRDLKPSNILLDENLDPKVADFGLSKFATPDRAGEATASTFSGTVGYMPPEYGMGTSVSTKGDVYSYGIVLLELLSGRQPASGDNFGHSADLRGWVMESFDERPLELLDSTLTQEGQINPKAKEQMMLVMRVALFCTIDAPQSRPTMTDVLAMLRQVKGIDSEAIAQNIRTLEDLANEGVAWGIQKPIDTNNPLH